MAGFFRIYPDLPDQMSNQDHYNKKQGRRQQQLSLPGINLKKTHDFHEFMSDANSKSFVPIITVMFHVKHATLNEGSFHVEHNAVGFMLFSSPTDVGFVFKGL